MRLASFSNVRTHVANPTRVTHDVAEKLGPELIRKP